MDSNTTFTIAANSSKATEFAPMPQLSVRWYQPDIVYVVVSCILAFMIVLGNSLVICAFRVNRRLRTASNMLLMSLATADILIGTISVPMWVYTSVPHDYSFGDSYKIFDIICGVSSVLNLTVISLERCYALIYPIKHRNISKPMPLYVFNQFLSCVDTNTLIITISSRTLLFFLPVLPTVSFLNKSVLAVIFVVWVLALLAGSVVTFPLHSGIKGMIITVAFCFAPLVVILVAYGKIFDIARAHARGRGTSSFKKELRIATTVAVVTGLFIICWTPFFGINLANALCASSSIGCEGLRKKSLRVIIRITKWLQYGNWVCNPIVYGLRNDEFRQTFHKILLGLCCKKAPLFDNRNNANGNPHLQQQSPNRLPSPSLIDRRESNRREFGIQSRRIEPVSLQFVDALHGVSPGNDFSTCPVELCNPAFKDGQEEIGIYRHDAEFLDTRL